MRLGPACLVALGLIAAGPLAACGGDGVSSAGMSASASKAPAPAGGPSWEDYMVLRDGRTCTSTAKVGSATSTAKVVTRDVQRDGGLVRFTIDTTTTVAGSSAAPTRMRIDYDEQPDGSLRSSYPVPRVPGFATEVQGTMRMPSIDMLRSGESATSEVHLILKPTDPTTERQILSMLDDDAEGIDVTLTIALGPAAPLAAADTPEGAEDVIGVATKIVEARVTNAQDEMVQQAFLPMLAALKEGEASSYWARGTGQIRAEAGGVPVTLERCTG